MEQEDRNPALMPGSTRGFTLAEILVAISIFVVLGSMLVVALRSGIDTWRGTEDRRMIFEHSQMVLKQIQDDLQNMAVPRPGDAGEVDVRFLCDLDGNRRYRLRFVRTLEDEGADEALRASGTGPPDRFDGVIEGRGDPHGNLKPLGGLMEVVYVMDPDPDSDVLYRGVRSPIGGSRSLFIDENIDEKDEVTSRCTPVADGVLYLGFLFWTQYTTTWDLQKALTRTLGGECGPEVIWDSTRGVLPDPKSREGRKTPNVFWLAAGAGSRHDPSDDVFPRQVRIVVCAVAGDAGMRATLARPLDPSDDDIPVDSAGDFPTEDDPSLYRYVKVGTEWIWYESRTRFAFKTRKQARGARGSKPVTHEAGEEVRGGRTFVLTVALPAHRGHWVGEGMSKLLERHAPEDPPWVRAVRKTGARSGKNR